MADSAGFDERPVRAFRCGPDPQFDPERWPATVPAAAQVLRDGLEGEWGMRPARWDELDIVGHWRRFLQEPGSYFRHWLSD